MISEIDREQKLKRIRPKKRELHKLPYTDMKYTVSSMAFILYSQNKELANKYPGMRTQSSD